MDCWPSGESIHSNNPSMKGLFAKMLSLRLFLALLAHDVLNQVRAVTARFVLARPRVSQDIHRQSAGMRVVSDSRNAARLVVSGS